MKTARPSILIDVSRLVGRLMRGRLPTGVDRVALAYVRQYGSHSRAFVRDGRFHVVLPERFSQALFHLLLHPPSDFKSHAWRLIAQGAAVGIRSRDLGGSIFFNIGHSGLEYHRYPDMLRRMDVRPVFMVHDLIPITHPEFCRPGEPEKHRTRMLTVLELARGIITNSQATLDALAAFADAHETHLPVSTPAFLAPHDFEAVPKRRPTDRPYFVVLGTIEPRKNHLLLLQVWKRLAERMGDQAPLLVVIGQRGWECENVVDLLERCEPLRNHILELSTCSDAELATWLHHARALLFPSFAEGFGLPLVEALACGTPVIASDLAVFREIAHSIPDYLDPLNGIGWLEMIVDYAAPDSQVRDRQLKRMSTFVVPTWDDHFRKVDAMLEQAVGW
jgi:glycosyltransferase involved in cell wall biosynthesis